MIKSGPSSMLRVSFESTYKIGIAGPQITFRSMSFNYNVDKIPYKLKFCLYHLV